MSLGEGVPALSSVLNVNPLKAVVIQCVHELATKKA
jgi:hypothetical protein